MTKAESISQHIAKRILANKTRKGFSTLYSEALEETQMSQATQHPKTDQQIAEQKTAQHIALQTRVAELETRVAALEAGKN
jgi:uncharacterized protein YceH (UPF0502 family)